MTLATVGDGGRPSARIVLLRGMDERGVRFYTNYRSRKGHELDAHPFAALVFYWDSLERQVRVEGEAERLGAADSDAYFRGRPRGHQVSAWASRQSEAIPSRAYLDERVRAIDERFAGTSVPRPPFWGGYRVVPARFEFWQGRADRAHDRLAYIRSADDWRVERLSP